MWIREIWYVGFLLGGGALNWPGRCLNFGQNGHCLPALANSALCRKADARRKVEGRAAFGASLSNAMLAPCSELVGCSIFVFELPIAADQHGLKVIVRIRGRITSGAVTDL